MVPDAIRLLDHGYNTLFRVDRAGERWVLRMSTGNSGRTLGNLNAEMAWIRALSQDTDLWVPESVPGVDGGPIQTVPSEDFEGGLRGALFRWLPGPLLSVRPTEEKVRNLGSLTRVLHAHGAEWTLPSDAELSRLDSCLAGAEFRELDIARYADIEAFREVLDAGQQVINRLIHRGPVHIIHFDLHAENLKWHRGRPIVFDFDDCVLGHPALDAVVTIHDLRDRGWPETELFEAAYWTGLGLGIEAWGLTEGEFETLVAAQDARLANDMLSRNTPEARLEGPREAEETGVRLRRFLERRT